MVLFNPKLGEGDHVFVQVPSYTFHIFSYPRFEGFATCIRRQTPSSYDFCLPIHIALEVMRASE